MYVDKPTFAKLLRDNERRVCWQLGDMPGALVHEWRTLNGGRLLLRQMDMTHETLYWVSVELV